MNELYLLHNSGLGDHIIINGMVRELLKRYDRINLFCSPHNINLVRWMYRDEPRINLIESSEDKAYETYCKLSPDKACWLSTLTRFSIPDDYLVSESRARQVFHFDQIPYHVADIPFEKRWSSCHWIPEHLELLSVFKSYNVKEGEYIFVHDESSLGKHTMKIRSDLPIVRPQRHHNPFHLTYLILNAVEIHCCDSAFLNLINSLPLDGIRCDRLFFHKYAKFQVDDSFYHPTLKPEWIIIGR